MDILGTNSSYVMLEYIAFSNLLWFNSHLWMSKFFIKYTKWCYLLFLLHLLAGIYLQREAFLPPLTILLAYYSHFSLPCLSLLNNFILEITLKLHRELFLILFTTAQFIQSGPKYCTFELFPVFCSLLRFIYMLVKV